ncbi:hypothetical protein BS47DRAFT_1367439 [Hydnum rufescens UP504]|uniref:Uncharacterized protein n=1 Tax=Hydnum rufescens UP504 TaxID=1448309 RepID=A0A9P6AIB8_9AGAM|nr:hypothetical protein BS47DRAFT_1367439 [Hydnum rufescens UP504]
MAHLTSTQTICQITRYCDTKSERFIESLHEYYEEDWDNFKSHLLEFYPSEEEKPYYKCLKRERHYRKQTISDNEGSSSTTDSDESLDLEDSDEEPKQAKNKKGQLKPKNKQKKDEVTTPKPAELSKVQESIDPMKSNIDDLAEKIGQLTLALGQLDPDKVA